MKYLIFALITLISSLCNPTQLNGNDPIYSKINKAYDFTFRKGVILLFLNFLC